MKRGMYQQNISTLLELVCKKGNYDEFQAYLNNNEITDLDLSAKRLIPKHLTPLDITHIFRALQGTKVTRLNLSGHTIGKKGAKVIAPDLGISNLEFVDFSYTNIGDEGVKILAKELPYNTVKINFAGNEIGDEGAKAVAIAMQRIRSVTHLDLSDNLIRDTGAKALAKHLLGTDLNTLNLSKNCIKDAKNIIRSLPCTINILDLSYNGASEIISAENGSKLATLTDLLLCGNLLDDNGAKNLASALRCNNSLEYLDLSYNDIGSKGARAIIFSVLPKKSGLTIYFKGNIFGKECKQFIEKTLAGTNADIECILAKPFEDSLQIDFMRESAMDSLLSSKELFEGLKNVVQNSNSLSEITNRIQSIDDSIIAIENYTPPSVTDQNQKDELFYNFDVVPEKNWWDLDNSDSDNVNDNGNFGSENDEDTDEEQRKINEVVSKFKRK